MLRLLQGTLESTFNKKLYKIRKNIKLEKIKNEKSRSIYKQEYNGLTFYIVEILIKIDSKQDNFKKLLKL